MRTIELKIGITVLLFMAVIVSLVVMFGKQSFPTLGQDYEITAQFENISGVKEGAPVFMNGVRVGKVKSVDLIDTEGKRYVDVKLLINKKWTIYTCDECRINSALISMTETTLQITRNKNYDGPVVPLKPGEPMPGVVPTDIVQSFSGLEGDITSAVKNISDAAGKLGTFIDRVNKVVGSEEDLTKKQDQFLEIIGQLGSVLKTVDELAKNVNTIISDEETNENIHRVIQGLPDAIDNANLAIGRINTVAGEASTTLTKASKTFDNVNTKLDNITPFTEALGEDGPEILKSVRLSSRKLDGVMSDLSTLLEAFSNPDGSLGQLLNNPDLYDSVQAIVQNVEEVTYNLKPVVDDFRVFSDRVARDPSMLGVRGAISPPAPVKGLPPYRRNPRLFGTQNGLDDGVVSAGYNDFAGGHAGGYPVRNARMDAASIRSTYDSVRPETDSLRSAMYTSIPMPSMPTTEPKQSCLTSLAGTAKKSLPVLTPRRQLVQESTYAAMQRQIDETQADGQEFDASQYFSQGIDPQAVGAGIVLAPGEFLVQPGELSFTPPANCGVDETGCGTGGINYDINGNPVASIPKLNSQAGIDNTAPDAFSVEGGFTFDSISPNNKINIDDSFSNELQSNPAPQIATERKPQLQPGVQPIPQIEKKPAPILDFTPVTPPKSPSGTPINPPASPAPGESGNEAGSQLPEMPTTIIGTRNDTGSVYAPRTAETTQKYGSVRKPIQR
ncbi:MAG: MlaD family protein [Thermoguttaceae bacterium]